MGFSFHTSPTIPREIINLSNLEELVIVEAKLQSTIPSELAQLTRLRLLHLDDNPELTGTIPVGLLTNNTNLQSLFLSKSKVDGNIPWNSDIEAKRAASNLTSLTLTNNQLTGTIPIELGTSSLLNIVNIEQNQLVGTIPEFIASSNIVEWKVGKNHLTGSLPLSLVNQTQLEVLWVHGNKDLVSDVLITAERPFGTNLRDLSFFNTYFSDGVLIADFCSTSHLPDRVVGEECAADSLSSDCLSCDCFTHCCFGGNGTCRELVFTSTELHHNIFNMSADRYV